MKKAMVIAASLLATGTLFAVTPGVASAETASTTVAVRYADLDLTTPKGQKALERRIARAARTICGLDDQTTGTRMRSPEAASCYQRAQRDVSQRVASVIEGGRNGG